MLSIGKGTRGERGTRNCAEASSAGRAGWQSRELVQAQNIRFRVALAPMRGTELR